MLVLFRSSNRRKKNNYFESRVYPTVHTGVVYILLRRLDDVDAVSSPKLIDSFRGSLISKHGVSKPCISTKILCFSARQQSRNTFLLQMGANTSLELVFIHLYVTNNYNFKSNKKLEKG